MDLDPFRPELRDGKLYGRGSCDMKGGVTTLAFAVEALRRAGVRLRGDVVFCSNTDEESSGVGGWAAVQHGVRADAGICAEPTGFDAYAGCRGTATGVLTVPGRAGHVEMPQPHWRAGGAVNAIEKALPLLESMGRLRDEWRTRPDQRMRSSARAASRRPSSAPASGASPIRSRARSPATSTTCR